MLPYSHPNRHLSGQPKYGQQGSPRIMHSGNRLWASTDAEHLTGNHYTKHVRNGASIEIRKTSKTKTINAIAGLLNCNGVPQI